MSDFVTPLRRALAAAGAALSLASTGCLITSTPQFKAQQHTAPFLVPSSAFPDTRDVVVVDYGQPDAQNLKLPFSADVISQDDPSDSSGLFTTVSSALYIDYGVKAPSGGPFAWYIQTGGKLAPGMINQTATRKVEEDWFPGQYTVPIGCHTATLVVSHIFDDATHCPMCASDTSSITWQVLACNSTNGEDCTNLPLSGAQACAIEVNPASAVTCASVEIDAGASICPNATDGGAQ
jgi:hypothetical protein